MFLSKIMILSDVDGESHSNCWDFFWRSNSSNSDLFEPIQLWFWFVNLIPPFLWNFQVKFWRDSQKIYIQVFKFLYKPIKYPMKYIFFILLIFYNLISISRKTVVANWINEIMRTSVLRSSFTICIRKHLFLKPFATIFVRLFQYFSKNNMRSSIPTFLFHIGQNKVQNATW